MNMEIAEILIFAFLRRALNWLSFSRLIIGWAGLKVPTDPTI